MTKCARETMLRWPCLCSRLPVGAARLAFGPVLVGALTAVGR